MSKWFACANRLAARAGYRRKNIANPIAQILSLALLLRCCALDANDAATAIEQAINRALEEGVRTGDEGAAAVSTDEMGDIIARRRGVIMAKNVIRKNYLMPAWSLRRKRNLPLLYIRPLSLWCVEVTSAGV